MTNYHCQICEKTYWNKGKEWLSKAETRLYGITPEAEGAYSLECIDLFVDSHREIFNAEEQDALRKDLRLELKRLHDENVPQCNGLVVKIEELG